MTPTRTPKQIHRRLKALTAALGLTLLAACGGGVSLPGGEAPATIANPAESYLLEPGNRIRVTVFNQLNLSGDFQLDPGGSITLPLIGSVPAAGVTASGFGQRLEERMKRDGYLLDPRVAVEVLTFNPFYVMGEVRGPGEFPYAMGMTVLSAIARAGGYDYRGRQGEVILVRNVGGKQQEYRANERTPILPGDIIRVLERNF